MPDHVHLVYPTPECGPEEFVGMFKRAASRALREDGVHPFARSRRVAAAANMRAANVDAAANGRLPTPWSENAWHVFLYDEDEVFHAIGYVNDNPVKAGRPAQNWPFVTKVV